MLAPLPACSIVDTHTHTFFSDGVGTFEENACAAVAAGCRVMVSTDHLTLPHVMNPSGDVQVVEGDLTRHRAEFEAAAAAHPELEYLYGFEELGPDEVWRRYQRAWLAACQCDLFDIMAHPDLAQRFVNAGFAPTIDLAPLWDEMVACAHDCGKRVELSTAGWRKGVGDYYPAEGLLERFFRAGVPISVGSDGHYPKDICDGIAQAYDHAARIGYRTVDVPRADGSWEQMPIV